MSLARGHRLASLESALHTLPASAPSLRFFAQVRTITLSKDQQDALKEQAARRALELITPKLTSKSIVGVGTGSTANFFIDALAEIKHAFDATVSSSEASAERLKSHGIHVMDLNSTPALDVYVDGADEANDARQLIKGAGAALTREKIVASAADEFFCIVDETKRVKTLGAFPLPVEVIPMARGLVARALVQLGGQPEWREGVVTDNGNWILDVHEFPIEDPLDMEQRINDIPGVVCNGIFAIHRADTVVVASAGGVIEY